MNCMDEKKNNWTENSYANKFLCTHISISQAHTDFLKYILAP